MARHPALVSRPTLYVCCGLPGSGKSYFANRLRDEEAPDALVLSQDDIRDTCSLDKPYRGNAEKYVRDITISYVKARLTYRHSCVVDSTNLTKSRRSQLAFLAMEFDAKAVCVWVKCSKEESIRRSAKWIPAKGVLKLAKTFEPPDEDEGWDEIRVIDAEDGWTRLA